MGVSIYLNGCMQSTVMVLLYYHEFLNDDSAT